MTDEEWGVFIMEAHKLLADRPVRSVIMLDEGEWQDFTDILERPPAENPELRKLLAGTPPWREDR